MTKAEFDAWHAEWKAAVRTPVRGVNAKTGLPAPVGVGETTDYAKPVEVVKDADVRVVAFGELTTLGRVAAEPVFKPDGKVDAVATAAADSELAVKAVEEAPLLP